MHDDADTARNADADAATTAGEDPFAGVFGPGGVLDIDVVSRRLPALVDLLRHHEPCFALRLSFDSLAATLLSSAGKDLRGTDGEQQFEDALRAFSRHHLHEIVADDASETARRVLQSVADDTSLSRKRRRAAAAGVALVAGLPDDRGLRGRGLFDLLLRISLEELQAQEGLRRRAAETGGLGAAELEKFWNTYPALRHHYEKRYRHDVQLVLAAIESDVLPQVISLDVAMRGAHRLLQAVAKERGQGGGLAAERAQEILRETIEDDLLDGGRELVLARWQAAGLAARDEDAAGDGSNGGDDDAQRPAVAQACDRAMRLTAPGSPGGELILFSAYMRSVIEGSFHVRDADEAAAAGAMFGEDGLSPDGALAFARYLARSGDDDAVRRVLVAGVELWPQHAGLRAEAVALSASFNERERAQRHGPTYGDHDETFAEIPDDDDDDDA